MRNILKKFTLNITKKYEQMSIQMAIARAFTTVSILGMVFMGLSLVLHFTNTTTQMITENTQRVMQQANLNLDSYLRRMMKISDTMYYRVIKPIDVQEVSVEKEMNLIYEENRDSLVSISLFSGTGELITSVPLSTVKKSAKPEENEWFLAALNGMENLHFSSPYVQRLFESASGEYNWVVSLSRYVQLTSGGVTKSGVLLVDMNFAGIEQVLKNVELDNGGYMYLIDGNGEIIYHPKQQLIYAGLSNENNIQAASYSDGTHNEKFEGDKRQITVKTVGYTGWKLVGVVPDNGYSTGSPQILFFGLSLLLFSAFSLAFVNFKISAYISEPIQRLDKAINSLRIGVDELEIEQGGGCYEVERLTHTISTMVSTMRHLMEDIIEQERQKRRSELEILQSQINPHFLYNTLDSIIWMTQAGRYEESIQMVTSLARFFRISLSRGKRIITLADELEHAKHYMTIQQIRFKNKFITQITAQPDTENLYTLKLVVQPLLENAIYHGMASCDDDGVIRVNAWCDGDDLVIDVTDNGMGMRPEIVNSLLDENCPEIKTSGSGMGVRNVDRRIKLNFGERYGLSIFSEPDEGTSVRIRLPKLYELDAQQKEDT